MMKSFKKIAALIAVLGMLGAAGAVYAATIQTPADIAAGLTGKSMEDLYKERAAGKTFGTIAGEAGKLEEFKTQMLEQKKAILEQRVQDGKLTQGQADQILSAMENNRALCDGTGNQRAGSGKQYGADFGQGKGMGRGIGKGPGGAGNGMGAGRAWR